MLLKLPHGRCACLSAARTITGRRKGMESEKDPRRGHFNCSYADSVTLDLRGGLTLLGA